MDVRDIKREEISVQREEVAPDLQGPSALRRTSSVLGRDDWGDEMVRNRSSSV